MRLGQSAHMLEGGYSKVGLRLAADGQISEANVGGRRDRTFAGLLGEWSVYLGYLPDNDGPMTTRTLLIGKLASKCLRRRPQLPFASDSANIIALPSGS